VGVVGLPLEALPQDAVGIVPVGGGAGQELGDHGLQEGGVAEGQRLPVLEDVPPVALVVVELGTAGLAHLDGEDVPGAAGVAVAAAEGQRQVLPSQPLQVGVPAGLQGRQEVPALGSLLQRGQERLVAGGKVAVGRGQEAPEVVPGDAGAQPGHSAPHDVEQGVGEVPAGAAFVLAGLEPVGAGHPPQKALGAALHVLQELRAQVPAPGQKRLQGHHRRSVQGQVGHHEPLPGGSGFEGQGCVHQVGAAAPAHVRLLHEGFAPAEGGELGGGEEPHRGFQPQAPGGVHPEGFAGFGAVGGDGAQAEEGQARSGQQLRALVAVDEGAELQLEAPADLCGQDVLEAVQDLRLHPAGPQVHQLGPAHEPEAVAGHPAHPEGQAQVLVGLLEDDAVAVDALEQVPADAVGALVPVRERLPQAGAAVPRHPHHGLAPRVLQAVVDAVVCVVGEQGVVRIAPAGGERAVAGHEQPVVGIAHHAHEERRHAVETGNPEPAFAVEVHDAAAHFRGRGQEGDEGAGHGRSP